MKAKVYKTICLIVALIVAVFTAGYAFAWYLDHKDSEFVLSGASAGAYFDSGNGSEETPFVIANSTHMRNLAVLQNMGRFVDENGNPKIYYFEIKKTIEELDMGDDLWLPPIGNDDAPFIGVFNGNGKSIKNLKVTTDKTLLKEENYPVEASSAYKFSNAVGLFGNTGKSSEIRNFILNNPVLLVGSTSKTSYSTGAAKVVGLAVGHVAGKCQSIGVRTTGTSQTYLQVADANTQYSTFNSILGELGDGVQSSVTGGGHTAGTGGTGNQFGSSFDIPQMADRLVEIGKNKKSDSPSWLLPDMDYQSDIPVPVAGEKIPFSVSNFDEANYVGANAVEQTSNLNIGYFLGNQNKFDNKDITAVAEMTLNGDVWEMSGSGNYIAPRWFYEFKDSSGSYSTGNMQATFNKANFNPLSKEAFDALPQNVKDFLPEKVGDTKNYDCIILRQTFTNNAPIFSWDKSHWSYHGQVSYMGKTYGEGFRKVFGEQDYAVDENGYRYTSDGNKLDENGYMFKDNVDGANFYIGYNWPLSNNFDDDGYFIDEAGNRYFDTEGEAINGFGYARAYNGTEYYPVKESGERLALVNEWGYKINLSFRTGQGVRYQDYTNGIFLPNSAIWFKPSVEGKLRFIMWTPSANCGFTLGKITRTSGTADNPFKVNYNASGTFDSASSFKTEELIKVQNLPVKVFVYYEIDVTEDVKAGNVEYMLMEYGSNGARFLYLDMGASAAEDTSAIVPDKVSAVDFIYSGVEITQEDVTGTDIKIGDFIVNASGTVARYDASKTSIYFENLTTALKIVYVRLHNETGKHAGKTICLEGSTPALNTDSEVHATYATYVCPTISGGSGTVSGGGGGTVTPTPDPDPKPDDVAVTSVSISGAPTTMTVGGTADLSATVSPDNATNKTVTWTSSSDNIATVDSAGKVTAKAAGEVTITATADGKSDSVKITVKAQSSSQGGSIDLSEEFTNANGRILNLSNPEGDFTITSSQKFKGKGSFKVDGETVSGALLDNTSNVSNIVVTATKAVKVTIRFGMSDGNASKTAASTVTVTSSVAGNTYDTLTFTADSSMLNSQTIELTLSAGETVTITPSAGKLNIISISYDY